MRNYRKWLLLTICSLLLMVLAACGEKSEEKVVKKIAKEMEKVEQFKMTAEMTMHTGETPRNYMVDIWYQKGQEDFYRVNIADEAEETEQVILKNAQGVYILTPALQKSFKFQADWPEKSSQPYIYQSLINDVVTDTEAVYQATEDHYIFLTKTNYQNNTNLPYQEVYFDKKTYMPQMVKVLDQSEQAVIEVVFQGSDMSPTFTAQDFDEKAILQETLASKTVAEEAEVKELKVLFPLETAGAELAEQEKVSLENGERIITTYKGEKNFTLIQEQKQETAVMAEPMAQTGELVHIGPHIGVISKHGIEWQQEGVDFYISSKDMTMEEMIDVAASVEGIEVK